MSFRRFQFHKNRQVKNTLDYLGGTIYNDLIVKGNLNVSGKTSTDVFFSNKEISNTPEKINTLFNLKKETLDISCLNPGESIQPGQSKIFELTLKGKPSELLILNFQWFNYQFKDGELNTTDSFVIGKITMKFSDNNNQAKFYINEKEKYNARFFELDGEYSNETLLSGEFADSAEEIGVSLGYSIPDLNAYENPINEESPFKSFFIHDDILRADGKVVIKNITIEQNKLLIEVENQSSIEIKFQKSKIIDSVPVVYNNFSLQFPNYTFVSCIQDKILCSGPLFATIEEINDNVIGPGNRIARYVSPIFVTNQKATEFKIINDPRINDICYNSLFDTTLIDDPDYPYINIFAIDGTPKYNNANEFFCAFIDGYDCNILLYDSETRKWSKENTQLKRETKPNFSITDINKRIFTKTSYTSQNLLGKKPMDIKDISGEIHCMITTYRNRFHPVIDYTTNLKDNSLNTILDETTIQNLNYSYIDTYGISINSPTYSKIIDANYLFSCFGLYVNNISGGTDNIGGTMRGSKNFFLKTTDGGNNWNDILRTHYEYSVAQTTERFISDDGNIIEIVIITGPYDFNSLSYYDNTTNNILNQTDYSANWILFNRSTDGGNTWKYPTGNWSIITKDTELLAEQYKNIFSIHKNDILLHYDEVNNETIVGLRFIKGQNYIFKLIRTIDNGESWRSIYPYPYLSSNKFEEIGNSFFDINVNLDNTGGTYTYSNNYNNIFAPVIPKQGSDANSIFGCFSLYNEQSIDAGSYITEITTSGRPNHLGPLGMYNQYYNTGDFSGNIYTWESTNEEVINIEDQTNNLENLPYETSADRLFEAFFGSYGSNTTEDKTNLYTTEAFIDKIRKIEVEYTEFI